MSVQTDDSHGQTGLNVASTSLHKWDLIPMTLGGGEVGRVGMAVDSLRDFEVAFQDIPLTGSVLDLRLMLCKHHAGHVPGDR